MHFFMVPQEVLQFSKMHGAGRVKTRTMIKSGEIKFLDESNNVKSDSVFVSFAWRKEWTYYDSGHYVVNIGKY